LGIYIYIYTLQSFVQISTDRLSTTVRLLGDHVPLAITLVRCKQSYDLTHSAITTRAKWRQTKEKAAPDIQKPRQMENAVRDI
jgi:hypothetical protein